MYAVILAGGRGSRLGDITRKTPKPMTRVGDLPLLHHQINLLLKYNIRDIVLLVNYLKDPIIEYFGNGSAWGTNITYFEEKYPLGTTGGLKEIEHLLKDDFLILYGDVMINMHLDRLIDFHRQRKSDCTLVLHPNDHPHDSDLVETDDHGHIIRFHPKPHLNGEWYHNMVNAGLYILSPKILSFIEKSVKADFGRDIFPRIYDKVEMFGYHTTEYLKDMGTPDRLLKVINDLESGRIEASSYEHPQKAIFLDRDGVLNTERSYISKPEELDVFEFTPQAIRKINHSGFLSVVVTNQSAIARNLCTEEDVRIIHKKLETILGEHKAWVDDIYFCPHHPDKGFPEENPVYKIDCDCRKPGTGMFKKAITKFNIDPVLSYMIGDSERDIQAGINAGCKTIGVRTGYGIRKTKVFPDYMFENLAEAVDFIVDDPFKNQFSHIQQLFSSYSGKLPWVILIGGNTRSGKSTLATYLRFSFEKSGRSVLQVGLDNWLLPDVRRSALMNVYERFQLNKLETDVKKLIRGHQLVVSSYANHPERKSQTIDYNPEQAEIIIIEGVVALSSEILRKAAHLKIFISIETELFVRRFNEYYKWRGISPEETALLMKKREVDEYQLIEKESKLADLIINSSTS
jgi:D,D-heptose 1,7-bisphosphate phosphatase